MRDPLFARAVFERLSPHRLLLLFAALVATAFSFRLFLDLRLTEDVAVLLPDGEADAASQFKLLNESPFSRKAVVHLTAEEGTSLPDLLAAADRMATGMGPPLFSRVETGPGASLGPDVQAYFLDRLPSLLTEADLAAAAERLRPEEVDRRIRGQYAALLSPAGWMMKDALREDPLGFRELGLSKLRHANLLGEMTVVDGHFVSRDGRSTLIVAETPVALTDSGGARELLGRFSKLSSEAAANGVRANWLSAHRYTLANADAIRRDLALIVTLSSLGVLGAMIWFLRSWRALPIFAIPLAALFPAAAAAAWVHGGLSGIALGFGGVLLGVSVDYGIHVYYVCRHANSPVGDAVRKTALPVAFAALTSLAGFAVLLFSELPGQRQLAVFSLTGILLSWLAAVYLLPHALGDPRTLGGKAKSIGPLFPAGRRGWAVPLWAFFFGLALWGARGVAFDGDLRRLSVIPPEIQADEAAFAETWGPATGRALFFSEGATMEEALAANDRLFSRLRADLPETQVLSLAPFLPSAATQEGNRAAWRTFWSPERRKEAEIRLSASARPLGFSVNAFAPFAERLTREGRPSDEEELRRAGLGELVDAMLRRDGESVQLITLAPDTPEVASFYEENRDALGPVRFVSPSGFTRLVGGAIRGDFLRYLVGSAVLVSALTALLFRAPRKVAAALLPAASGLAALFGATGALGIPLDLFNIVTTALVIGLGVDYGIFMVYRVTEGLDGATDRAVLLSGITTLAGIATLTLASHPALSSIGVTILLGVGAAIPSALWVVPALLEGGETR